MKKNAKNGKEFLDKCRENGRIVDDYARIEGIIVAMDSNMSFKVVKVFNSPKDGWEEELLDVIPIIDIINEDDDKMIINFKEIMFELVGKKRYMIEKSVYQFLSKDDDIDFDDEIFDFDWDDAEERAKREADEEEAAEQEFERYLRGLEEQDD